MVHMGDEILNKVPMIMQLKFLRLEINIEWNLTAVDGIELKPIMKQ